MNKTGVIRNDGKVSTRSTKEKLIIYLEGPLSFDNRHGLSEVIAALDRNNPDNPRYRPDDANHKKLNDEGWKIWIAIRTGGNGEISQNDKDQLDLLKQKKIEWAHSACYTATMIKEEKLRPLPNRRTIWVRRMGA